MSESGRLACIVGLLVVVNFGCGRKRPPMAPVEGKVFYNGQPLTFGCVMFQPERGWPAVGHVQPDGTFSLSTFEPGDGALIGRNRVRVTCFEGQRPGAAVAVDGPLGKSLIPRRYNNIDVSGIEVDVSPNMEPLVIELTD